MRPRTSTRVSLTAMLGTPVTDAQGNVRGRLKDIAVATGAEAGRVAGLVLKTRQGLQIVPSNQVMETPSGTLELRSPSALHPGLRAILGRRNLQSGKRQELLRPCHSGEPRSASIEGCLLFFCTGEN